MTLENFLATVRSKPSDPASPLLVIGLDDLTDTQKETALSAAYDRAPYLILEGLGSLPTTTLDNGGGRFQGTVRVSVMQPMNAAGEYPDGTALRAVAREVYGAALWMNVDELDEGLPLESSLKLIDYPAQIRKRLPERGLIATVRFSYTVRR